MSALNKRVTVRLEPRLHKLLRNKSVQTGQSISKIVSQAVREAMAEDAEDLRAFDQRRRQPTLSFAEFVRQLKRRRRI